MNFAEVANDSKIDRVTTPKSGLAREFIRLWHLTRYRLARGERPWLGVAMALATCLVAIFLHFHILRPELWRSGDVYAALPLPSEVARLPISFLLPTAYLPLWAACVQLVVVIGLGELILGRWLTIVVAMVGHFGATLIARVLLESVHSHLFGFMPVLLHGVDTGPSAATTAVGACLLIAVKMNRCALLLIVSLVGAAIITRGVDGVEHTTALVIGLTAGVLDYLVISRFSETPDNSLKGQWSARLNSFLRVAKSTLRVVGGVLVRTDSR
ncbi:MAG TPA: hypothetical protein VMU68_04215 [Acidimicrobiales bacterium]|nr:hypothetical protein [Acidimicrobiales bacterium]